MAVNDDPVRLAAEAVARDSYGKLIAFLVGQSWLSNHCAIMN